jgi:hypothetical protein
MNKEFVLLSSFLLFLSQPCSCHDYTKIERTTYERLIATDKAKFKIPTFKNRRIKELQALISMIINRALDRVIDIIGPEATDQTEKIRSFINQPHMKSDTNDYVRTSYTWAIADFEDQIKRDNERLGGIGAITQSSYTAKKDLITLELDELNERYEPIVRALIKLMPETRVPKALSLDALKNF